MDLSYKREIKKVFSQYSYTSVYELSSLKHSDVLIFIQFKNNKLKNVHLLI